MKLRIFPILGATLLLLIFAGILSAFAQEVNIEQETQWLWAEVSSVDIQKNELTVLSLDYDTGEEKEIVISVDNKTTYENVKSLFDLKPSDTVGIDYLTIPDGKCIAKNINLEKPEVAPDITADE